MDDDRLGRALLDAVGSAWWVGRIRRLDGTRRRDAVITFVVPAFDEEKMIGRTIDALHDAARAVGEPYEIVVADDASTDRTAHVAREHGARVVSVENRQIAATRNAGARAANGSMLIFVDADTVVTPAVVGAAARAMRRGAVGGGCATRFDGPMPPWARLLLLAAIPLYRAMHLAAGCFVFCTRQAFDAVGGFDETLFGGEEAILSRALARQGRFVVLREHVTTSGRKLRAYSAREILGTMARLMLGGMKSVRKRDGLDIWYGARRPDPHATRTAPEPASSTTGVRRRRAGDAGPSPASSPSR